MHFSCVAAKQQEGSPEENPESLVIAGAPSGIRTPDPLIKSCLPRLASHVRGCRVMAWSEEMRWYWSLPTCVRILSLHAIPPPLLSKLLSKEEPLELRQSSARSCPPNVAPVTLYGNPRLLYAVFRWTLWIGSNTMLLQILGVKPHTPTRLSNFSAASVKSPRLKC